MLKQLLEEPLHRFQVVKHNIYFQVQIYFIPGIRLRPFLSIISLLVAAVVEVAVVVPTLQVVEVLEVIELHIQVEQKLIYMKDQVMQSPWEPEVQLL